MCWESDCGCMSGGVNVDMCVLGECKGLCCGIESRCVCCGGVSVFVFWISMER